MLNDTYHWAETQFVAADLGEARRTDRLVSTMAAIARAPEASLPRQLGSAAGAKAAYRLFDCGAVTREAVMSPHLAQCRAAAARHPVVLMVHDDTTLDFSAHRLLRGAGRVGDDRGRGLLAHSCLAVLPAGKTLGLAHQTIWARPPKGVPRPTRESAVWAETVETIGRPPMGTLFVSVADRGADVFDHLERVRETGWEAVVRAAGRRRRGADGTARGPREGCRHRPNPAGRGGRLPGLAHAGVSAAAPGSDGTCAASGPVRVQGVRVWNGTLEWLLLTTRPVEILDQALELIAWYSRRWVVEEFHKAWKTGCRAEQRRLEEADRLVPLLGALAIVAVRLLGLRDAARRHGAAPAGRRRPGGRAGDDDQDPRRQASATGRRLHHQPRLAARRRPVGRLSRP